ncbi:MAG: hypothetical protein JXB45_07195 [Candidatus Krumholzibacteriota bacterium]|nr:hypothetical protein [Candidatus Krumholzibacteriota bacterium]
MKSGIAICLCMFICLPVLALGQSTSDSEEKTVTEALRNQNLKLEDLEKIIEELREKMEKTEKKDELRRLQEKARQLSELKRRETASDDRKFYSGLRQHSALNPNISLGGEYYFCYGTSRSEYNRLRSENSWGTGQFFLREMELAVESPLDPYSRAKAYISISGEGAELEEGYMESLNWPLNMNLKLGQYKTQFGTINRFHDHALPQLERPLVMSNFFGYPTLKGVGLAANFLLPSLIAQVNELDLQVISGGADHSFTAGGKHNLVFVGHLKNFWDINRGTYVEVGLSGATGHNNPEETCRTDMGGIDLRLKWSPPDRSKYRGVEWWTEALYSRRDDYGHYIESWGMFSLIQCRLNARWLASGRFDYSQLPQDSSREEYGAAVSLDFWQSEFVLVRLQYTHIDRNFDEDDHRYILQIAWAMGPHKHEAY